MQVSGFRVLRYRAEGLGLGMEGLGHKGRLLGPCVGSNLTPPKALSTPKAPEAKDRRSRELENQLRDTTKHFEVQTSLGVGFRVAIELNLAMRE